MYPWMNNDELNILLIELTCVWVDQGYIKLIMCPDSANYNKPETIVFVL